MTRRIRIDALDGPLRYLRAIWSFEPLDEDHTRIHFSVDYEFNNPVLVASRVLRVMSSEILDAFEQRAAHLFRASARRGITGHRWLTTS